MAQIQTDNLLAQKERARSLYHSGRLDEALRLCQQIVRVNAGDPVLWALAASINVRLSNLDEAESCAQRATRLDPGYFSAYVVLGEIQFLLKKPEQAIASYERALELDPTYMEALSGLARIYEISHDFEMARETLQRALQIDPGHHQASLYMASLQRRMGDNKAAFDQITHLLAQDLSLRDLTRAAYEMGILLEQQGQYKKAMQAYHRSQRALNELYAHDGSIMFDQIDREYSALEAHPPATWNKVKLCDSLADPVFLLGFPRSGTTLIEQILSAHSRLAVTNEEAYIPDTINATDVLDDQVGNYPYDLHMLDSERIHKLRNYYWQQAGKHLRDKPGAQQLVDKSPFNIIYIPFILRIFPRARIIFALRDPRDVCLSCFTNIFESNPAVANFTDINNTAHFYAAVMNLWLQYRQKFKMNVFELRYESVVYDLEGNLRQLVRFLDLKWERGLLEYYQQKYQRAVVTPSYQGVAQPVYKSAIGRWRHYEYAMQQACEVLVPFVDTFNYH